MKEVFRHRDFTITSYYQSLIEAEGIPTMLRNEGLSTVGIAEIPIPEFYPNICVMNDEDYDQAHSIIKKLISKNDQKASADFSCKSCNELNPSNFEVCYACGEVIETK